MPSEYVIVNQHETAMVVLKTITLQAVNLESPESSFRFIAFNLQEHSAGVISIGRKHKVPAYKWRRNVCRLIRDVVIAPQKLPCLGIDTDQMVMVQGDSDIVPPGLTGGSRSVTVGGVAVSKASEEIIEKGRAVSAHMMEAAEADIEYSDGTFRVAGTDRTMSLFEVAKAAGDPENLPGDMEPGLDSTVSHTPDAATFPNGCHICEIEIDPDTGIPEIQRYTVVDDFGDTINPLLIEGQVHGGIVQGVGQALHEHTIYDDESGQLVSGSFMDYRMPRADDVPRFSFSMRNEKCTTNPLGIKGTGEAGAIGAPPSAISAIVDALSSNGESPDVDMPATPDVIWALANRQLAAE